MSSNLIQCPKLCTTPHPDPYQLSWIQQGGPRIQIANQCTVAFAIGHFIDVIICDIAPLDCIDLLL